MVGFRERPRTALFWRYRRWTAILVFLVLATPLVVGVVHPDDPAAIFKEGRKPTPVPNPHTFTDWMWFPVAVDIYLRDHFGLRQAMIALYHDLTDVALVLVAHDGRMFWLGDEMVN